MVTTRKMEEYLKIAIDIESQFNTLRLSNYKLNNEIAKLQATKFYDGSDCAYNEYTYNQQTVREYVKQERGNGLFKSLIKLDLFGSKIVSIIAIIFIIDILAFVSIAVVPTVSKNVPILENIPGTMLTVVSIATIMFTLEIIYRKLISSSLKKEYKLNRHKHNERMERSNALYANVQNKIACYNRQLTDVNKEFRETNAFRNKFYSENVLPEKYRNLVAVSTMYQWLRDGRCTQIYGHGGLFDTYEYDLRLGAIVGNLQELNQKMNVALQNQQILIKEVRRGNEIAQNILQYAENISATQREMANDISSIKTSSNITAMQTSRIAMYQEYEYYRNH